MNLFEIAPANPIKFKTHGDRLDSHFSLELLNSFQDSRCYFQKWQTNDSTTIQILSDFADITLLAKDLKTDAISRVFSVYEVDTSIIGQTFKVYQIDINFSLLNAGDYYFELLYTNEISQLISLESEPFSIQENWPDSLLFEYTNSENNFGVVFSSGIIFKLRVEGVIANFTPESDDLIYNDQKRNAVLLDSVPYRTYTLFVGNAAGVAPWIADKVNRALSCDMLIIENEYYQKTEGATWEVNRAEEYLFIGMTTEIMPVENKFLERLKNGAGPGEVTIVQKIKNYTDVAGDISIPGLFKSKSLLEKICIVRTGPAFVMTIGITDGGDEIGEFIIGDLITTLNINYLFDDVGTIYINGISSVSFLSIIYKQLDERPIPTGLGDNAPAPAVGLGTGATIVYIAADEVQLETDFNMSTGLGLIDTPWEGWAVADGRNGTADLGGLFLMGYKAGENVLGAEGGSSEITINNNNLPAHTHKIAINGSSSTPNLQEDNSLAKNRESGGNANANLGGIVGEPTLGKTSLSGGINEPQPINIINKHKVVLYVTKIA